MREPAPGSDTPPRVSDGWVASLSMSTRSRVHAPELRTWPRSVVRLAADATPRLQGVSVGTDVQSVRSVADSIARFGDRYLRRIWTERELDDVRRDPERLAARFAGKEAVIKLLRPRPADPMPLTDVEILSDRVGAPTVRLHGHAATLAAERNVGPIAVSLSHDADVALGTAVSRSLTAVSLGENLFRLAAWPNRTILKLLRSTRRPTPPS
jgi:holo-[acyl-carrier protein] synthase